MGALGERRVSTNQRRDGAADLVFTGVLLGQGETSVQVVDKLKNAWVERGHTCRIYRSTPPSNKFVIEFIASSQVSNERDRCEAFTCAFENVVFLKTKLLALTSSGMPEAAKQAVEAAIELDNRLGPVLFEDLDNTAYLASIRVSGVIETAAATDPVDRFKQNLRLADDLKALDDYAEALRVARNACDRVAGGIMGPEDTIDRRVQVAHNALCMVEDAYDRLRKRLPDDLKTQGEKLVHEIRIATARSAAFLASRPPEGRMMMHEISAFSPKLSEALALADSDRAKLLAP